MNPRLILLVLTVTGYSAQAQDSVFVGSTPAHPEVRTFLGISHHDSIDFIRWKLVLHPPTYQLACEWGLAKPGTNGFSNGKETAFAGTILLDGFLYRLVRNEKTLHLQRINSNLFHLLNKNRAFLVGNGGYSYVLNSASPAKSDEYNLLQKQPVFTNVMAFEGRTPCQELSKFLGLNKGPACNKMKWYILLYSDSLTRKPTYYLKGGRGYRKETMQKGNWSIVKGKNGALMYILDPEKKNAAVHLLRVDENILLFTDPDGNLLVGNQDFSFALNRTVDKEPDDSHH
jgi:hypothetical protein